MLIISENVKPSILEFKKLMEQTDLALNLDAEKRDSYYAKRNGRDIEIDVYEALCESAKGTNFDKTIHLVSGQKFPDIVAAKFYGVEVKSTKEDHWTSTGSSILESSRIEGIERIFLTFGKLGRPVRFLSRPYEECLSGIAVTHYPRYKIDMMLKEGETIFDKMGISYDQLRKMDNPVAPVSKYYKEALKNGESLWWMGADTDAAVPPTVRLWTSLSPVEKKDLTVKGYCLFPEVLTASNSQKYNSYSLWLVTRNGVVNNNVRDSFSAGGKIDFYLNSKDTIKLPAAFGRIKKYKADIMLTLYKIPEYELLEYWKVPFIRKNRLAQWCELITILASGTVNLNTSWAYLKSVFGSSIQD